MATLHNLADAWLLTDGERITAFGTMDTISTIQPQLDAEDDPLGGVSAVDFSVELRWRINRDYGLVLFGDGGGAFSGRSPTDSEQYFWGTGAGLRYYTPIGPIRLDVAVPLDRRDGIDDPFQLYISLGQAF